LRRVVVPAVVLAAVAVSGCGVLDDKGPAISKPPDEKVYGPSHAVARDSVPIPVPPRREPSAAVARSLAAGAIGVVDLTGAVGVRPKQLVTAKDGLLQALKWTRWGADGAEGRGSLRMLVCQPTCAGGQIEQLPAVIRLTGVRTCGAARYFATSKLVVDPAPADGQPASYVRAPC
jgi:hypothetical protein